MKIKVVDENGFERVVDKFQVLGFKTYSCFLTQNVENDPSATVLENEIGEVNWSYFQQGVYHLTTSNDAFDNENSCCVQNEQRYLNRGSDQSRVIYGIRIDANTFSVQTYDDNMDSVDDSLFKKLIEIRIPL